MGKRGIEAHFDPELNCLFHAFDALGIRIGHKFWNERRDHLPLGYIGGFEFAPYREIAPPPSDKNAALILICSVIERHVGRLEELLAEHEQIEAAEAAERYDRAALDCSPAFERHRRYQSARHRKLMRTLETLRKMRKEEFGAGNGKGEKAEGKCQTADDRGQTADDGCRMADAGCEVRSGGCGDGESGEMTPEGSQSPIVGFDSNRVIDDSMNDKIGILSHEGTDATDRPYQGACDRQSLPSGVKIPENVQNEANPESTQSPLPLDVESSMPEPVGQKRSQSGKENAPRSTPERLLVEGLRLYPVDPRTYRLMPNHCLSCSTPGPT